MAQEILQKVVIGDTLNPLQLELLTSAGTALDLTNCEVRVFLRGDISFDRPESEASKIVANCATVKGSKIVSRLSGSFVSDGVEVGMLLVMPGIVEGAQVEILAADSVTLDTPAISSGRSPARFWNGLLAQTVGDPLLGIAQVDPIGARLDIGPARSDVFRGRTRVENTVSDEVGWFDVSAFEAVRP